MSDVQRGSFVRLLDGSWAFRYRDAHTGSRPQLGGFATKAQAHAELKRVLAKLERGPSREEVTFEELCERYLAAHDADPLTLTKLTAQLKRAREDFGERPIGILRPDELAAWRRNLPANRHHQFRAVKQVLAQAERWEWVEKSPAKYVQNPKPKAPEIVPFASWEEVEAVSEEIDPRYAVIPIFATGTGLRPEEWIALERRDLDRADGVVHVRRVFTYGRLKDCAKTSRQRRRVPLRRRVLDALDGLPPRLDSPLLFPSARGGHLDLAKFRHRHWTPALKSAGADHRRIYAMRHTFASWAIRDGVSLFYLSRVMGTSIGQIDATYGHLVPRLRGIHPEPPRSWRRAPLPQLTAIDADAEAAVDASIHAQLGQPPVEPVARKQGRDEEPDHDGRRNG